ncbi:hypothetical protein DL98DRAFT_86899 [Cadophora sp. DSE1049]|nr:hypothetical protein DL98DRAFT_86899 [Cadophora sp. DSE1049]
MASSSPSSSPSTSSSLAFESAAERRKYRHPFLEILASNSTKCLLLDDNSGWPPRRHLNVMTDPTFGGVYNNKIHPKLLNILKSLPQFEELHVLDMATSSDQHYQTRLYEAVLVIFPKDSLNIETAKDLVTKIDRCIKSEWTGRRIFVDICESTLDLRHDNQCDIAGRPPRSIIDDIRARTTPLPGSSIGLENSSTTGTLSFYFKHKTDTYGVSNCHVLIEGSTAPYSVDLVQHPSELRSVVFPSNVDYEHAMDRLKFELYALKQKRTRYQNAFKYGGDLSRKAEELRDCEVKIQNLENEIAGCESRDNRHIGSVYASSGEQKPSTGTFRQDWAIFKCDNDKVYSNKHRTYSPTISETEAIDLLQEYGADWLINQDEAIAADTRLLGFTNSDTPTFDTPYIKLQGARSEIRIAKCSSTVSTLYDGSCGLTTEYAFGPAVKSANPTPLTLDGDSGSVIMSDQNLIEAVVWGGNKHATFGDLTYATSVVPLLEDIRQRMGWDIGSIQLLGA